MADYQALLRRLVLAIDAEPFEGDVVDEYNDALEAARAALGLVLAPRCDAHGEPDCRNCGERSDVSL